MKLLSILSIVFAAVLMTASATNLGYFPSDAFFVSSMQKDKWVKALKQDTVTVPYYYGRGMLCGYAGVFKLTLKDLPPDAREFILGAITDDEFCASGATIDKGDDFAPRRNDPGVYFYDSSFDIEAHLVGHRYNQNFAGEVRAYPWSAHYKPKPNVVDVPDGLSPLGADCAHTKPVDVNLGTSAILDAKNVQILVVSRSLPFVASAYSKRGVKVRRWKDGVVTDYEISPTSKLKQNLTRAEQDAAGS